MNLQARNTKLAAFMVFCLVSIGATLAANGRMSDHSSAASKTSHQALVPVEVSQPPVQARKATLPLPQVADGQAVAMAGPDRQPRSIERAPFTVKRPELKRQPVQEIQISNDVLHSLDMHEEGVEPAAVEPNPPIEKAVKPLTGPDGRIIAGVAAAAAVAAILLNNSDDPALEGPLSP